MNKIQIHTVVQPVSDVTTFVISCNRLDLLQQTLESFYRTNDYVTKMVILDDSGEPEVFEKLVNIYGDRCDIICFPNNRGLWWALDFMTSYCETEYIFYLEDDWEFVNSGYIQESKELLEKYREIGIVDISQRTFEFQGIDSYDRTLVDDRFYWKKPWKITDHHAAWHIWCGSPNLKRRDDMLMLGKVEKWHTEHNIDRKFTSLGFRGIFTKNKYVEHLGDNRSKMVYKRQFENKIPYDYYPLEILSNRTKPKMDYYELDRIYEYPSDVTLVTCLLDLNRNDRSFEKHYLSGVESLLSVRFPLAVFSSPEHHDLLSSKRKDLSLYTNDNKIYLETLTLDEIKELYFYEPIQQIIKSLEWQQQSSWMAKSIISSDYYIPLTLYKLFMLKNISIKNPASSKRFYWIDSGITNSFNIQEPLTKFDFLKLPKNDKMFLSSFPYYTDSEIHGYNINKMSQYIGEKPDYVCRATIFGGTQIAISNFFDKYVKVLEDSIGMGCIGAEESIFTIIEKKYPDLVDRVSMPNGDINNLLNIIKKIL
jgi:hypothetical protein